MKFQFEELEKLTPLLKEAVAEERKGAVELAQAAKDEEAAAAAPAQNEEEPLLKTEAAEANASSGSEAALSEEELERLLQLIYFAQASICPQASYTTEMHVSC